MKWKDLEEETKSLLDFDNPKIPPNSGGTKKEEDVVGETIIAQCKDTSQKNISILHKDFVRLIDASKLQGKFPIFVTKNSDGTFITIKSNSKTKDILKYISLLSYISKADEVADMRTNQENLNILGKAIEKLKLMNKNIINKCTKDIERLLNRYKSKFDELHICNLFD